VDLIGKLVDDVAGATNKIKLYLLRIDSKWLKERYVVGIMIRYGFTDLFLAKMVTTKLIQ
jgi:hypothetical protein